ncbi:YeeE/YedE family protein [Flexithrix dorotheae]|uniref:YeeE/YedE family protein n=1 Tax=Flexithrix dorotheae TaxID=70993 RepID=UPI00036C695F|nr:YeeE/YedE family protein [Flexithrix dorotheae]
MAPKVLEKKKTSTVNQQLLKGTKFVVLGILFGIIMTKSEAVSWYRIQEMFRFQSFHMYGIIGSALGLGVIIMQFIKRRALIDYSGQPINLPTKPKGFTNYILGGTIFGLGWALTGACPGPVFVLIGNGFTVFLVVLASAVLGTFVYGVLRNKLPH